MEKLVDALEAPEDEKVELLHLLLQGGLEDAIDAAFISAPMARAILGGSYPRLSPLLEAATRTARPMVNGWARLGFGGGGGETEAGKNQSMKTPNTEPGLPPGRVPHVSDVGDPSGAPEGTRRSNPGVVRSARLLRSFTLNKKGG